MKSLSTFSDRRSTLTLKGIAMPSFGSHTTLPDYSQKVPCSNRNNGIQDFKVGPDSPTKTFSPTILTTALDLANRSAHEAERNYRTPLSTIDYLGIVKLALDFNNPPSNENPEPYVNIKVATSSYGAPYYYLRTRDGLIIDPLINSSETQSNSQGIFIGKLSEHPIIKKFARFPLTVTSDLCLRIEKVVERALDSMVTQGHPRLVLPEFDKKTEGLARDIASFTLEALKNSPYNERFEERPHVEAPKTRTTRFSFIDALHSLRDGSGDPQVLIKQIEKRPSLLCIRGWCGGTVLHEASEYGNLELVKYILEKLKEVASAGKLRDLRSGKVFSAEEVINFKNRDGSTALQLAQIHKHKSLIPLLLAAGADSLAVNRFGEQAIPHNLNTKRMRSEAAITNPSEFNQLIDDVFSETRFSMENILLRSITSRLANGERRWQAENNMNQYVCAVSWHSEEKPTALALIAIDAKKPQRFWLSFFGVAADKRVQGNGTECLKAIKSAVANFGGKQLYLQTDSDPENKFTIDFYSKNGFKVVTNIQVGNKRFLVMKTNLDEAQ